MKLFSREKFLTTLVSSITKEKETQRLLVNDADALNMTQKYLDFLYRKIETIQTKLNDEGKNSSQIDVLRVDPADVKKMEFPPVDSLDSNPSLDKKTVTSSVESNQEPQQPQQPEPNEVHKLDVIHPSSVIPSSKQLNKGDAISLSSGKVERKNSIESQFNPPVNQSPTETSLTKSAQTSQPETLKPGHIPLPPTTVKPMPPMITAKFSLPNAKVGEPYLQTIIAMDSLGREVKVIDMKIPEDLGLKFIVERQSVSGTPNRSGDIKLSIQYQVITGEKLSTDMVLIVNPDPKSLWKVVEPDPSLPFPKPHSDGKNITIDAVSRLIAASRRGRSHEHGGSFRDDDFYIETDPATGWSIIIVADGAGSAKYSREGSRVAVTTAGQVLSNLFSSDKGKELSNVLESDEADKLNKLGTEFHYIFHSVCSSSVAAIEKIASEKGEQPRAFATTFLAAAVRPYDGQYFVASFWLGDGAIAIYEPNGTPKLMGTPDGGEYAGQTLFLDRSALSAPSFSKRTKVSSFDKRSVLLLMTDGVSDPYFETDNGLSDPAKWKKLWDEIAPKLEEPEPEKALTDWLHFFIPGHHDDRTIALLDLSAAHSE